MSVVKFDGGKVSFNVSTAAEAKLAIKEIKLKKKEFALRKQQILAQQKSIRADFSHSTRLRSPMLRGGGILGKFVRALQSTDRYSRRAGLAQDLAPLEQEKQTLDERMNGLDSLVLQLESFLLQRRV